MQLSKNKKILSQFLALFLKSASNFEYFFKKMTFIAYLLPQLRTAKEVVK